MAAHMTLAGTKAKQALALAATLLIAFNCFAQDQNQPPTPPESPTSQTQAAPPPSTVTIPAGTRVALVLTHPILSRSVHRGDDIYAQITSPVTSENEVVIPPGTFVQGKIDKIERQGGRGELRLQSMSVVFPDGYVAPVAGPVTLESDEGYALKDPGKGRFVGAFALPAAGLGLGTLIGRAFTSSRGTTINTSLPPSCGVPTPGCMNNSSSFTFPPNRLKGMAIGGGIGLAAGGIASIALLTSAHNFFLDVGSPVEMVLQQPMTLQQGEVDDAIRQSEQHPVPEQRIVQRPQPMPPPPNTDHGTCYTPGTPGTPDTAIPGMPATADAPGTPDTIIPGIPPTPPTPYPCPF
jgi:hypothetical protein